MCLCVYGSRHCMCLFGSGSRNGSSRHVTVCIACISPESSKIVTFSAKKSLGCYHHRDILRFPAILVEKSDDFCYNRDEKRRKSRVSVVLSFPQVVGNAITSTIATLHQHKKVKRKINLVPGFSDVQRLDCNSNPTFWCRENCLEVNQTVGF